MIRSLFPNIITSLYKLIYIIALVISPNIAFSQVSSDEIEDIVVVSPDVGGIKMARAYAKKLNAGLAVRSLL